MRLPFPLPYKTYGEFEQAERNARLFIEKRILDPFYKRKPLTLEEIIEKAGTIPDDKQTEAGIPISILLIKGAQLLKDNPNELYNFYLTEIKPHLSNAPVKILDAASHNKGILAEAEELATPYPTTTAGPNF